MTVMLASIRYTYDFIRSSLPEGATRVLEIGCGSGELAALMIAEGLEVVALDSDEECVTKAHSLGVDAQVLTWPAPLEERFDAVLFTRSLHHIDDLRGSISAAAHALNPGGRIIVEDFRAEGTSKRSARWFAEVADRLCATGALLPGTTLEELLQKAGPSSVHDDHLHTSTEIARDLAVLNEVTESDAAYYFRYLEPHLREPDAAQQLLEDELDMIAQVRIDPLGKRFVVGAG